MFFFIIIIIICCAELVLIKCNKAQEEGRVLTC